MTFRELRERAGFTQELLADATGLDQTTISQIETGKVSDPRYSTVAALAKAMRVKPSQIMEAIHQTAAA